MPSWKKVVLHGSSGSLAHLKLENLTSQNVLGTDAQGNVVAGSVSGYSLPTATSTVLGGIKVGNTLTISSAILNAKTYEGASGAVVGGSEGSDGIAGYVPAATSGQALQFLRGDGTWQTPTNTVTRLRQSGGTLVAGDFTFAGSGATTVSYSNGTFTISSTDTNTTYSVGDGGLTEKNFTTALKSKLDGIAASADNYGGWTISDSTRSETIGSGNTLTVRGSGATAVNYDTTTNTLTISSTDTDTDTTYSAGTGLTLSGTTFSVTANTYAAANHTHDDRYLKLTDTGSFFDRIIDSAPGTLDTLNELAAAIGDDANFSASIASVIARKADSSHTHSDATTGAAGFMSATDKAKLDGIAASANNYSLPLATSSTRGGVKIGYTANGKNYPVQLSSEQMYVSVPWTDTDTDTVTSVGISGDLSTGNIELRGGGATTITKSGGTITITSTDTDTNTTYSAGTGLTLSGTTFSVTAGTYAAASHTHAISDITNLQTTLDGKLSTSGTAAAATSVVTLQDSAPSGTAGKLWWESDTGILKVYYGGAWVDAVPIPDSTLFYPKAGGGITGDVSISQTLTVTGNTTIGGNIAVAGTVDGRDIATDGAKLDGIASGANNYSLPTATSSVLGGIKVGTNLSISNGVLSSTDTDTVTSIGVSGDLSTGNIELRGSGATSISKSGGTITISSTDTNTTYSVGDGGLTEKNFTTALKNKLDGIADNANNYSLPTATASVLGGIKVGTNLSISSGVLSSTDTVTRVGVPSDVSSGDIEIRGSGATTVTKSGGTITISSTDTDTNTTYSAGTNLSLSGTTFNVSSTPSFSTMSTTHSNIGRTFSWYGGNLSYSSTSTGTYYRIMRVYYNQGHWGGYGTTRIKVYASQYKGGYQEWVLKNYTGGVYLQLNDYGISPTQSGTTMTLGSAVEVGVYSGLTTYYRDVYIWLNTYIQATYQLEVDGTYGIDADGDVNNYTKFVIWTGDNRTTGNAGFPETPGTTYHSVNYAASAGSVAWTNVSGRPTAVSSFTNDAGYLTSYTDTNTVTSVGISGDLSTGNIELRGGGATTITKSGGTITISSTDTDTNTVTSVGVTGDLSTGNVVLAGSGATSVTKSGGTITISSTDTNTVTSVGISGDLSTGNIELRGSGATSITKSGGTISISSTDTNTTYSAGTGLTLSGTTFSVTSGTYAAASHTHSIANVTGLQTALDGKSDTGHTHAVRDVTGLEDALNGKLSTSGTAASATSVVTIQDSAPSGTAGKLWWESDTGKLKVYYGSAWIDATPIPDMSLYYSRAGGAITGDVTIQQTLTVVGNVLIEGTLTETSDITLKENINPLQDSLNKVLKLNGVSFNKKTTPDVKEIGFIAQEVQEIFPELVSETEDGIKTVSYSRVTAVLVETVKQQQSQIEELKELVAKLTEKLNSL